MQSKPSPFFFKLCGNMTITSVNGEVFRNLTEFSPDVGEGIFIYTGGGILQGNIFIKESCQKEANVEVQTHLWIFIMVVP